MNRIYRINSAFLTNGDGRGVAGSALVSTLLMIVVLTIIVTAFMQSMAVERRTANSYKNKLQAELAAEAALKFATQKISEALSDPVAGGVAFTTWSYFPSTADASYTAITRGRPQTLNATGFLSPTNTTWLFSPRRIVSSSATAIPVSDPDDIASLDGDGKIDFSKIFETIDDELSVPWYELDRKVVGNRIQVIRFAFWVEDESARFNPLALVDIDRLPGLEGADLQGLRDEGRTPGEAFPTFFMSPGEYSTIQTDSEYVFTEKSISQLVGDSAREQLTDYGNLISIYSNSHNRIRYGPYGPTAVGAFRRGMRKLNLNWSSLTDTAIPAETRVGYIANAMEEGAPEFLGFTGEGASRVSNLNFYQDNTPVGGAPDASAPEFIRREMRETIAASIIDYIDTDDIPTQPSTLPDLSIVEGEGSLPPPVRQITAIGRPRFFGVGRGPFINEVATIWNAEEGDTQAGTTVQRTGNAATGFTYEIPIVWKFELWNMSDQAIPPKDYSIRGMHVRQIRASAFGFGGEGMPTSTEVVFPLGSLAFDPGEIKIVEYTERFTSTGPNDLGTTWTRFRRGPDGLGGLESGSTSAQNQDDEPERHARSSFVLFDTDSSQWISTTNYLDSTNVLNDGVAAIGPGNMGASKGNRINDPRIQPHRGYALNQALSAEVSIGSADSDRDWGQQSTGSLGTLNNQVNSRFYQHLGFWFDRPKLSPGQDAQALGSARISRVRNQPMASVGELGNIFDPSWFNPANRGSDSNTANLVPYRQTVRSPFKGGASLRVGQPDGKPSHGANSWILTDVFGVDHELDSSNRLVALEERFSTPNVSGLVNINMPRSIEIGGEIMSTTEMLFRLRSLDGGSASATSTFDTAVLGRVVRDRLTKVAGSTWKGAKPFFLPGEISELEQWQKGELYEPAETVAEHPPGHANRLIRVNRGDFGREEILQKSINMITTGGNVYRIYLIAQIGTASIDAPEKITVISSVEQSAVVDFVAEFNEQDGELESLHPTLKFFSNE